MAIASDRSAGEDKGSSEPKPTATAAPRSVMPLTDAQDNPLWINVLAFVAAAALVWAAGTRLARYLGEVSDITRFEQAFIGMFMLGIITSLPEVANVVTSSYFGNPTLAVNNLLGSASINVLLLAIGDALTGRSMTASVARPSTLLQGALSMLALTLVAIAVSSGDVVVGGIGLWPLGLCVGSIAAFWLSAGYGSRAPWTLSDATRSAHGREHRATADPGDAASLRSLIVRITIAAAVILLAGYALARTGDALAVQTGLGSGMVGFLLIGVSTSLPELSTITAAMRAHRHAMAVGEVFGTNLVNISLILLADVVFTGGSVINGLGRFEIISSLLGVMLAGTYLVGLLEHRDPEILHMGYDSVAVILLFTGGLALLFGVG